MKRTLRRQIVPATLCLVAVLTTGSALAQNQLSPAMRAELRPFIQACMGDIRQFCPGVQRGGGRILACLNQNGDSVSAPCRGAIINLQAHLAERAQTGNLAE